jgi:tRNA(fMet)-specific endonuclease VapC
MAERYLIDSSAAIKYLNSSLPIGAINFLDNELDQEINMSIITKVEILGWNPPAPQDLLVAQKFTDGAFVLAVDDRIGEIAIPLRKATKVKLPDVLIAATAIANNFTLIADNDTDLNKIVALKVGFKYLNPFRIN